MTKKRNYEGLIIPQEHIDEIIGWLKERYELPSDALILLVYTIATMVVAQSGRSIDNIHEFLCSELKFALEKAKEGMKAHLN